MHQRYCTSSCIYEQKLKTSEQNKNKNVRRKKVVYLQWCYAFLSHLNPYSFIHSFYFPRILKQKKNCTFFPFRLFHTEPELQFFFFVVCIISRIFYISKLCDSFILNRRCTVKTWNCKNMMKCCRKSLQCYSLYPSLQLATVWRTKHTNK